MQQNTLSLTDGSIWKSMLMFAFPVFLGNAFQQLYNAFDSWVVGHYLGEVSLAAVSSSSHLIFLMIGFFNGMSMGAGNIIAKFYGARDFLSVRKAIHTAVCFGLIAGTLLTVFGITMTPAILRWMNTPTEVLPESIAYFRYYSLGGIFVVMYNMLVGIHHAVGDSRNPLIYLMISASVNVVLDLLFVGVFHMGVGSAAMATTISQGLSATLCFVHLLLVKEPYQLRIPELRIDKPSLGYIFRFGFPSGIQNSVISIANVFVQTCINGFGTAAMAGCGAYSKLEGFVFLPVICFNQALSTFVGQNLGAHNYERTKKGAAFGICCSMFLAELVGITCYLLAPRLISIFNSNPEVISLGSRHMRVISLFYFLLAFSHSVAAVMRGAGKPTMPMVTMLLCWCAIRVSYITIALYYVNQLTTVSLAYPISWSCSTVIYALYLFKGDWLHAYDRMDAKMT